MTSICRLRHRNISQCHLQPIIKFLSLIVLVAVLLPTTFGGCDIPKRRVKILDAKRQIPLWLEAPQPVISHHKGTTSIARWKEHPTQQTALQSTMTGYYRLLYRPHPSQPTIASFAIPHLSGGSLIFILSDIRYFRPRCNIPSCLRK